MAKPKRVAGSINGKQVHHVEQETHQLKARDRVMLAQIQEAMTQMNNVRANILSAAAGRDWGYAPGHTLEFAPNLETGEVIVIMRGEVKSSADQPNT